MLHTWWSAEAWPQVKADGRRIASTLARVTLFAVLHAFFQEHQYCGELDGGGEGDRVWMRCTCRSPAPQT